MLIEILCNDGSPLGVTSKSVYGEDGRVGIGGAEIALITLCEEWTKAGYEIILYNNPTQPNGSIFEQREIQQFEPKKRRDILITFRSPNVRSINANGFHCWFSTDQFTVGSFRAFYPYAEKVVLISDFHKQYFQRHYGIFERIEVIDLPVRIDDYDLKIEKVPGRCIFTSVPDRGLRILHAAWPLIKRDFKGASLVITSDYRLWGWPVPKNDQYTRMYSSHDSVEFLGAVSRKRLIEEQLKAQVLTYSSTYDELFCIATAEAQVAGAYPVTSAYGALPTTNMGDVIWGEPTSPHWVEEFVEATIEKLGDPDLPRKQEYVRQLALERFSPKKILKEWSERVFKYG